MGLGFMEIVIIGVVSLILLGPQRLPGLMRQAAKFYVQMRRTSNEFKSAFDHVVQEAEQEMLGQQDAAQVLSKLKSESPITAAFDSLEKSMPSQMTTVSRPDHPFEWNVDTDHQKNS